MGVALCSMFAYMFSSTEQVKVAKLQFDEAVFFCAVYEQRLLVSVKYPLPSNSILTQESSSRPVFGILRLTRTQRPPAIFQNAEEHLVVCGTKLEVSRLTVLSRWLGRAVLENSSFAYEMFSITEPLHSSVISEPTRILHIIVAKPYTGYYCLMFSS